MPIELDVVHLKRFVAIVECGGFGAAARQLNMTQQALSASMAQFEANTGLRFLERKRGSGVALTASGQLLLERARTHLALSERLMQEIAQLRDARSGSVMLGVGEAMASRAVAAAIARFHGAHPNVEIRLNEGYTEQMAQMLITLQLDFVLGGASYALGDLGAFDVTPLFEVSDVLAVRAEHPLAQQALAQQDGPVTLADLAQFPWLIPGARNDVLSAIRLAYARGGIDPPVHLRSDAMLLGSWLCLDHDYIVCVSPELIQPLVRSGQLTVLSCPDLRIDRQACLITLRGREMSPVAAALKAEILFELKGDHHAGPGAPHAQPAHHKGNL